MLLRLFYLYERSPKKAPVRCQGSSWINHKRKVLQRVVDRYGAYVSHLTALAEDGSVKAEERARLKGRNWTNHCWLRHVHRHSQIAFTLEHFIAGQ